MAGSGPGDLYVLSQEFLNACIEALDTIPTYEPLLEGAPLDAFVSPGGPAIDCCPQLTVHVAGISEGAVAPPIPKASIARTNNVFFIATVARCVPTQDAMGAAPTVSAQEAAAEQINADMWALWNHIYNLINGGDLFDKCCDVIWGALAPLPQSGGCGGCTLAITVCYDGYQEVLGT